MNCTPTAVLLNEATWRFVADHAHDDIRRLALQGGRWPDVDLPKALEQIGGRQTARRKLPSWAAVEGVVYPSRLALEQCSSEATARYKAALLPHGGTLVDLTGGLGVDCAAMAAGFERVVYVERQSWLCQCARHNFPLLGLQHVEVVNADAEDYLHILAEADAIYLDPARRDIKGNRSYAIADCSPDVSALAQELLAKAPVVLVKLSPMLDVSHTLAALPHVSDMHIVSAGGECKELLVVMQRDHHGSTTMHCANDGDTFTYQWGTAVQPPAVWDGECVSGMCLYEPNPSMMKAGCFGHVAAHYGLAVVSGDSHLLVGSCVDDFQGRSFSIHTIATMNKRELRQALASIAQANVAVRNFPMSAATLAQRLKLRDGGDTYIFGTTTAQGQHVLLIGHKHPCNSRVQQ